MDERVGDQLFPDDARNLRLALGVEALFTLSGTGVSDDEAERLLEYIGQLTGDVAAVDVALVFDLIADKSHRLDDEGRQCVLRRFGKQQTARHIELPVVHQVHVGQELRQRLLVLGERLAKLLFEKGCEIGQVHIARAQARHRRLIRMHQTRLLEQALDFFTRGGSALVRAVLYPDGAVLVHVGFADAFHNGDHHYGAVGVRHIFGERVHRRPHVL